MTEDIRRADAILGRELGTVSRVFSYPYGEYSPAVIGLLQELGFAGAVAQHSGVVAASTDPYVLPRFPMGGDYATLAGFKEKLAMRALEVRVVNDQGPVISDQNPPTLTLDILSAEANPASLRCFVQGREQCSLTPDPQVPGQYHVRRITSYNVCYTKLLRVAGGTEPARERPAMKVPPQKSIVRISVR